MEKRVKVSVHGRPIALSNSVKVFGCHGPLMMNEKDIFSCLAGGATVTEVNGKKEIVLNFANYNKENFPKAATQTKPIQQPAVEKKVEVKEEVKTIEEPISDPTAPAIDAIEETIDSNFMQEDAVEDKTDNLTNNNYYRGNKKKNKYNR